MEGSNPIYVEASIDGTVDELWELTQRPTEHERWDLRFSEIEYLPKPSEDQPQEFTYVTRIGFGLAIEGTGSSVASNERDAETTSVLAFRSDDRKSIITEGRGYWRYVDDDETIRFLTEYNYATRWGTLGTAINTLLFQPLMGWATAWSFDALRLWVEEGFEPETTLRASIVYALARATLAFIWVYQGFVPKLVARHPAEFALMDASVPGGMAGPALLVLGVAEVVFGLALLAFWRTRWLLLAAALVPVVLTAIVSIRTPSTLTGPFNPVALNAAMTALGVIGYIAHAYVPTAANCLRERETA